MIKFLPIVIAMLAGISGCSGETGQAQLKQTVQDYYHTYAERQDFEGFMDYYADEALLEDVVYGHVAHGREQIRGFFNWENNDFRLTGDVALVVKEMTIDKNTVITSGYFTPFYFSGDSLGPWRFIIKHRFNDAGKIIYQTDWINYTPRSMLEGGKNLNELIN